MADAVLHGVGDIYSYYDWGKRSLEIGVPRAYYGTYFPLQYHVFEFCAWVVTRFGVAFFTAYKLPNLLFDVGSFCALCLLLRRRKANPVYALLYWLHPWFLTVFSLGYVDFQFTFFVLMCLWLLRGDTAVDYLLAGIPLGFAFLMKPQAQILIVAVFFFGVMRFVRRKEARAFALLLGPIVLFLAYEW